MPSRPGVHSVVTVVLGWLVLASLSITTTWEGRILPPNLPTALRRFVLIMMSLSAAWSLTVSAMARVSRPVAEGASLRLYVVYVFGPAIAVVTVLFSGS